jgi:hypothetical protein
MAALPVLTLPLQTVVVVVVVGCGAVVDNLSGNKSCRAVGSDSWQDNEAAGAPIISLIRISSLSIAVFRRNKSWMV